VIQDYYILRGSTNITLGNDSIFTEYFEQESDLETVSPGDNITVIGYLESNSTPMEWYDLDYLNIGSAFTDFLWQSSWKSKEHIAWSSFGFIPYNKEGKTIIDGNFSTPYNTAKTIAINFLVPNRGIFGDISTNLTLSLTGTNIKENKSNLDRNKTNINRNQGNLDRNRGNINVDNSKRNINIDNSRNVNVNRNVYVRPPVRPYPRPPYYYGGFRYYSYHPYHYHPYRPYYWGPVWHPWGFFVAAVAVTAIVVSVNNQPYYYDSGVYYIESNGGYTVVQAPAGATIKVLPEGSQTVVVNETTNNYYYGGTFYEKSDGGYTVVPPTAGTLVENLPEGGEEVKIGDVTYVQYGETYYQPVLIDGKNMYEVVNVEEDKNQN